MVAWAAETCRHTQINLELLTIVEFVVSRPNYIYTSTKEFAKLNFCHMKTNFFSYVFFPAAFIVLLQLLCHLQFLCDKVFHNAILANLFFLCHATSKFWICLKHYIIFWKQWGHENVIIKTVGMWAQSQTARFCKLRNVLSHWDMRLTVSSAWGSLHC